MPQPIAELINFARYPLDNLSHSDSHRLIAQCQEKLRETGMFSLEDFLNPQAVKQAVAEIRGLLATDSFTHKRYHNIYFSSNIADLPVNHPTLTKYETINHTLCADQLISDAVLLEVYEYPPMAEFLARVMAKPMLYTMADPLARVNVMEYRAGEALNWHFDRSEFTTTLLLQAPDAGGDFEYRTDLRSDDDPNYEGVAALLAGKDEEKKTLTLHAGTLNVFRGKNTAHRVTPVIGGKERIIAVFSYYETPGKVFSAQERIGFYGRAA